MNAEKRAATGREPTFLNAWRRFRRMTLADVSQGLAEHGVPLSEGQLSRIERGQSPYGQDVLEALARVYHTEAPELLRTNPLGDGVAQPPAPKPLLELWAELDVDMQGKALNMLKALAGRF